MKRSEGFIELPNGQDIALMPERQLSITDGSNLFEEHGFSKLSRYEQNRRTNFSAKRSIAMNLEQELRLQSYLADSVDVMRCAYKFGWISTRDGNISVAAPEPHKFYISPSGHIKYRLTAELFLEATTLNSINKPTSNRKPSGELDMHRRLQQLHPKAYKTVLHLHPTYTVAAQYAGYELGEVVSEFPEVTRYTRVGQNVPALAATSEELAIFCAQMFSPTLGVTPDIIGLDRHGVVAVGRNPWEAFEHVERLEHICKIVLISNKSAPNNTLTVTREVDHEHLHY